MEKIQLSFVCLVLVLCVLIFRNAFENFKPTCKSYVLNVYLYMTLGTVLIGFVVYCAPIRRLLETGNQKVKRIESFVVYCFFASIVAMTLIPGQYFISLHIVWFSVVAITGFLLSFDFLLLQNSDIVVQSAFLTICVFLSTTALALYQYDKIKKKANAIKNTLSVALFSVILFELACIFALDVQIPRFISYSVLVIMSGLIMYHTVSIRERSKVCSIPENPPNYPKESTGFILYLINIFLEFQQLSTLSERKQK